MFLTTKDGRLVRYEVSPQGVLRFAGGVDAREGDWSWEGHISASEGAELQTIIDRADWIASPPRSTNKDGDSWEVSIRSGGRERSFDLQGDTASVLNAWAVLQKAGRTRLEGDLELLPRPGIDRLVERKQAEYEAEDK
ncbi:MAG: hypothetical protein GY894_03080 [Planctomycetes bacterium]|jgi:hypothetical protein|nr:hypothetical protein [Planctomycetota bacterium]MCP4838334.1 hypothetical protein [Planctomycetota bacterium]